MAFKKRLLCCRLDCPRSPCAAVEAERDWLPELLDELRRRLPELPVFTGTEPDDEDASVAGGSEQPVAAQPNAVGPGDAAPGGSGDAAVAESQDMEAQATVPPSPKRDGPEDDDGDGDPASSKKVRSGAC